MAVIFRPLPGLTVAALIALAILLGLGTWQVQRRTEKHALFAQIAARQTEPAAPVEYLLPAGDYAAFRQATAQGQFDHTREAFVFSPRTDKGPTQPGFKVITPFRLLSGDTILVDRGWIEKEHRDPQTRAPGQIQNQVEIEGVLRRTTAASAYTPAPDLAAKIFYARDSRAIAETLGVKLKTPLILQATSRTPSGPEPLSATLEIPDNHLSYAITWYSLALTLIVVYLRYHFVIGRLRFKP